MLGERQLLLERSDTAKTLEAVEQVDATLYGQYEDRFLLDPNLSRSLVSFQASKHERKYRWYKYKEAFSPHLVEYLLEKYAEGPTSLLDPFAGSGTALFAGAALGIRSEGIELLPLPCRLITGRVLLQDNLTAEDAHVLLKWAEECPWESVSPALRLHELRITRDAYSARTKTDIERFMTFSAAQPEVRRTLLELAMLSVLESVSFTRKDGQYLRWDDRSGKKVGKKTFYKGPILQFKDAICRKITDITEDLLAEAAKGAGPRWEGTITLRQGSCLDVLPTLAGTRYDVVMTSPPYCNRYDYTRTYALELAALGLSEADMARLRQQMLSCTVESRRKALVELNPSWAKPLREAGSCDLLQTILGYLKTEREAGNLNNPGIPRMVQGYFEEMACVIYECARMLAPGGRVLMVNDNVRYAGASVSVDLILSTLAEAMGLTVEAILVLPDGKGNSSQQMGLHGRDELRKCVYVWRKR